VIRRSTALSLCFVVYFTVASNAPLRADTPLRIDSVREVGNQSISVSADQVSTWEQGDQQLIAFNGVVLVEHGLLQVRAQRAIAWIDIKSAQKSKLTRLTLYLQDEVRIEEDRRQQQGNSAIIELATYGDLRVRAKAGEIRRDSLAGSEFYRAAVTQIKDVRVAPVQQVAFQATPAQTASNPPIVTPEQQKPKPLPPLQEPIGPTLRLPMPTISNASPQGQPAQLPPSPDPTPGNILPEPQNGLPNGPPFELPPEPKVPVLEIPLPDAPVSRTIEYAPRFASAPYQLKFITLPNGEQVAVITGGLLLTVRFPTGEFIDLESDQVVVWTKGGSTQQLFTGGSSTVGGKADKRQIELYLSGNVEIRYAPAPKTPAPGQIPRPKGELKVMRAERVYYDVTKNKALALNGDLEFFQPGFSDNVHLKGTEIQQLSAEEFDVIDTDIFASRLPSDPGFKLHVNKVRVVEREVTKRGFLGLPVRDEDGETVTETERLFRGKNVFLEVADVPIFYFPYVAGNTKDPLGPFQGVGLRQDQVYGAQILSTWDFYQLLGLEAPAGHRSRLYLDYLGERGPAGGVTYNYANQKMFGVVAPYTGLFKGYGIYDSGFDQLGGIRQQEFVPSAARGRVLARHLQHYENFYYQGQISYLSDHNFLESYYNPEFSVDPNQETFSYLKWQRENTALSILAQPNLDRPWVNETQWLPRGDAYLLGISFFDRLTYNMHASAGYAETKTPTIPPSQPYVSPTDVAINTGRYNINQELSLPLQVGPVKVVPYGVVDLAYYDRDIRDLQFPEQQNGQGRFYGGGGVRANMPLSRIYSDVTSELFNLNGIHHKINFGMNYFTSYTDVAYTELPQLDRLNDDATDQSLRDVRPDNRVQLGETLGNTLATSPLYDPQIYAIRRLLDSKVDTLDTVQVVQTSVRQRWQTKRGYPGAEHITDYVTLNLSASFFPDPNRDNFGEPISFVEYYTTWNIGDQTSLSSSGWFDPFDDGARYFTGGVQFMRSEGTSFSVGYRQIDPLESRAVFTSLSYIFSAKYMMTVSASYDFGLQKAQNNSLQLARTGSDMRLAFGVNYDALIQNFGVTLEVVPNIVASNFANKAGGLLGGGQQR